MNFIFRVLDAIAYGFVRFFSRVGDAWHYVWMAAWRSHSLAYKRLVIYAMMGFIWLAVLAWVFLTASSRTSRGAQALAWMCVVSLVALTGLLALQADDHVRKRELARLSAAKRA